MLLLLAVLAAQTPTAPQGGPLDVPVFTDSASGVALARPWDDWVFEPARSRGTMTVIFHPREGSLSEQPWGALALTSLTRNLADVAAERVASWQSTFGSSFELLTRDSLTVQGYQGIHLVVSGAISGAALDIEEYLIARDSDLILLQFRYPRGLPRDSIALGYERSLAGLRLARGAPATPAAPAAPTAPVAPVAAPPRVAATPDVPAFSPAPWREMWSVVGSSAWRASRADVLVTVPAEDAATEFEVRLDVVNDGLAPAVEVPLWLPRGAALERAIVGGRTAEFRREGSGFVIELGDTVPFQGRATLTVGYRTESAAAFTEDWLPAVQSPYDSTGQPRGIALEAITLRFDLPERLTAIGTGRLTTDLVSSGVHRQVWSAEGATARAPGFVIGRFRVSGRAAGRLNLTMWSLAEDARLDSCAAQIAEAWTFSARAFGAVIAPDAHVVVGAPVTRGLPGLVLLTDADAASRLAVHREVARMWWGGVIRAAGPGATWIERSLPEWVGVRAAGQGVFTDGAALVEALRSQLGDGRFREVFRTFATEYRDATAPTEALLELLGSPARQLVERYLNAR